MIIKSYEVNKINIKLQNYFLFYGENEGLKSEIIKNETFKDLEIQSIDDYSINGDFVESQAFAFLAIRSFLKLPISFPSTTGCKNPTSGGEIIKNF